MADLFGRRRRARSHRAALDLIARGGVTGAPSRCENFTTGPGSCVHSGRTRGAHYTAEAWCLSCIAWEALR